jgi:hypothetical protein
MWVAVAVSPFVPTDVLDGFTGAAKVSCASLACLKVCRLESLHVRHLDAIYILYVPYALLPVDNCVTLRRFHVAHTRAVQEEELEVLFSSLTNTITPFCSSCMMPSERTPHPRSCRLLFAGFGAAACSPWTSAAATSSATLSLSGRVACWQ